MVVRFSLCALALSLLASSSALSETPRERAERALDQLATLDFVDTPAKDICAHLTRVHGVPIRLIQEGPDAGHLYGSAALTVHLRNISLRSALNLVLDPLLMDYRVTRDGEIWLIAAQPGAPSKRPISRVQDAAFRRNYEILEKKIVSLEFVDTPFKDVIEFLSDQIDATIVIDRLALDAVRLEPDEPVSSFLRDVPLHKAMTALLYPFDLRIALRNEVLLVTLRDDRMPRRPIPPELHKLALRSVDIEFDKTPLIEALNVVADQLNSPLIADHRRIAAACIDEEKLTVTVSRRRVPAREALRKILEPHGLRVMVYEELLFITPTQFPVQPPQ